MAEIKNYLSYDGLSLYDGLIKKYIGDADASLLSSITGGELSTDDLSTIKALNDRIKEIVGTLDSGDAASLAAINDELDALATQISGKNVAAEGDDYVSASASDNKVTVSATESTKASLALADSALQKADITTGSANGTIAVEGEDVAVAGLGSAAYTESDAYAAAVHTHAIADVTGLQAALDGKVDKVEGSRLMTVAEGTKLDGIEAGAQVNVIETVKVNGEALTIDADKAVDVVVPVLGVSGESVTGLKLELGDDKKVKLVDDGLATTLLGKDVTVQKKDGTPDDQCVYEILQGGVVIGTINHPKDMVVTAGEVIVASDEEGLTPGKKYLKLTIANQVDPVYIAVTDLVDVYKAGAGISISDANEVSIALNSTQGNVTLSTDGGLKANLEGWEDVKNASHTHDNKAVLDGITAEKVAAWDAKQEEMVAITTAEIEGLFAETTSL